MLKVPRLSEYVDKLTRVSQRKDQLQKFEQEVTNQLHLNPKVPLTEQDLPELGEHFFKRIAKEAGLDVTS
ncbi:hypothetical protein [Paenibacillus sp. KN14-4R]|uniref:hypothetical protein n=1 Tax=Paenibacillus sp. KN14-4R TaxID=3445773 RepID=UPI003FA069FC